MRMTLLLRRLLYAQSGLLGWLMHDGRPQRRLAGLLLLAGVIAALLLHLAAGFHLPTPWDDEIHFLVPARNLAHGSGLVAPQLNAPQGLFWMPDGYALFMGLIYALAPASLEVARWFSFALVVVVAVGLHLFLRELHVPPVIAALMLAIWLVAPRAVVLGNVARMEALLLALFVTALLLAASERWAVALAVAALGALVHPIGIPLFGIIAVAAVAFRKRLLPHRALEWALVIAVAAILFAEAARLIGFLDLAREQLAFQWGRKAGRAVGLAGTGVIILGLNVFFAAACWWLWRRRRKMPLRDRLPLLAVWFLAAGYFAILLPLGNEIWYEVYSIELANVLMLGGLLALLRFLASKEAAQTYRNATLNLLALVAIGFAAVIGSVSAARIAEAVATGEPAYSFSGMTLADSDRAEWFAFVAQAEAELTRIDQALDAPALVQLDRMSNIDLLLADHQWQHLRLVQTTPVTPLDENAPVSFALYTIYPPLWRQQQVEERLPDAAELARVVSDDGEFELRIFDLRSPPG